MLASSNLLLMRATTRSWHWWCMGVYPATGKSTRPMVFRKQTIASRATGGRRVDAVRLRTFSETIHILASIVVGGWWFSNTSVPSTTPEIYDKYRRCWGRNSEAVALLRVHRRRLSELSYPNAPSISSTDRSQAQEYQLPSLIPGDGC